MNTRPGRITPWEPVLGPMDLTITPLRRAGVAERSAARVRRYLESEIDEGGSFRSRRMALGNRSVI